MIGVKSRAFNGGRGGAGSALRAAPSGTPAAPRPPSARHRPTIRCLRQSLWLKPALPANPLTTNYQFCRIPSLTTRGTLSVSHFRGRVHLRRNAVRRCVQANSAQHSGHQQEDVLTPAFHCLYYTILAIWLTSCASRIFRFNRGRAPTRRCEFCRAN